MIMTLMVMMAMVAVIINFLLEHHIWLFFLSTEMWP